jgi:acyl dehydratase
MTATGGRLDPTEVVVGTELPEQVFRITRADLVRYAGASGDFNPIHWNERVAVEVGLPGVIAHGMFTMALAGRLITAWTGDPGALVEYQVRFGRPVVVPDDDRGAEVTARGRVGALLDEYRARVDLTVTSGDEKVLSLARAVVRLT